MPVLPRDGRSLADVRAAPLQRQDDVREARRVQELQGHGHEWHQVHEHEAYHGYVLIVHFDSNK